jgi:hypothetical protein
MLNVIKYWDGCLSVMHLDIIRTEIIFFSQLTCVGVALETIRITFVSGECVRGFGVEYTLQELKNMI